ncbi:MAG: hypothetical protein A3F90_20325 [Deltaproteobacteria bacterium RIFCSPLOWO2_12_FULL_60_19]|nr:MAG: hypothetical protein A3F90_20325 [Deltaproteobacteria bacterium RIFCSPLOWO2_12_FULL_60_19]
MAYLNPSDVVILVFLGLGLISLYWGYRARNSSSMSPEKKAKVFKSGCLAGLVLIGLGIFTYIREAMSPLTPEKIVQIERGKVTLPMDIDAFTRWDAVEASERGVRYIYTVRKTPKDRDALANALRRQLTESVCEQELYQAAAKQHIEFEFVYKFADETYPAITLSPTECGNS